MFQYFKSAADFSLALSLFGASQAARSLDPDSAAKGFDAAANALQNELDGAFGSQAQTAGAAPTTPAPPYAHSSDSGYRVVARSVRVGDVIVEPSPELIAATKARLTRPPGQSPYVGVWRCQAYHTIRNAFTGPDTFFPPGGFPLTFTQNKDGVVTGTYPNPPSDKLGVLKGKLCLDGRAWRGTFQGVLYGGVGFVMAENEAYLFGAWTKNNQPGPPLPWVGIREK